MSNKLDKILIIDDDEFSLKALKKTLEHDFDVIAINNPQQMLEVIEKEKNIKVTLSDQRMPLISGIDLMIELKNKYPHILRIILTGYTETDDIIRAINEAGIFRYIIKPWNTVELQQAVKQAVSYYNLVDENKLLITKLEEMNKELEIKVKARTAELQLANKMLEELALTDPLTGIGNKRYFLQRIQDEIARMRRHNKSLTLIMIDVDYFKDYNDKFGHPYGDKVLQHTAKLLKKSLRAGDVVARYGGEEFVILLPETSKPEALEISERLRKIIESGITGLTISLGIASYPVDGSTNDDLIKRADDALYRAKTSGRNQVSV